MIKLERPAEKDEKDFIEMMEKWRAFGGRINPKLLRFFNGDYPSWLERMRKFWDGVGDGIFPHELLFFVKKEDLLIGATSIRYNPTYCSIACGIAPGFRDRGYGKETLRLILQKAREVGLEKVRITCDVDNIASQKIIEYGGGVFEKQEYKKNILVNIYWLELK